MNAYNIQITAYVIAGFAMNSSHVGVTATALTSSPFYHEDARGRVMSITWSDKTAMDDTPYPVHIASTEEEEADELRWQQEFRDNWDVIAAMADEALQEYRQGKTVPLERVIAGKH